MRIWYRWRWENAFTFGPWTKYHLFTGANYTACGRWGTPGHEPNFGQRDDNPPEAKRCRLCQRIAEREEANR